MYDNKLTTGYTEKKRHVFIIQLYVFLTELKLSITSSDINNHLAL